MKTILAKVVLFSILAATLVANAGQEQGPMDDRASAFVAGDTDAAEAFGQTEGLTMMGLAVIALVASIILLLAAGRIDNTCSTTLDNLKQLLGTRGSDDS